MDRAGQDSPCKHPCSACKREQEEQEEEEEEGRDLVPVPDGACVCVAKTSSRTSLCISYLESCLHSAQVTPTYIQTLPLSSKDFHVHLKWIRIPPSFAE